MKLVELFNAAGALNNACWCFATASRRRSLAESFFLAQSQPRIAVHRIATQHNTVSTVHRHIAGQTDRLATTSSVMSLTIEG